MYFTVIAIPCIWIYVNLNFQRIRGSFINLLMLSNSLQHCHHQYDETLLRHLRVPKLQIYLLNSSNLLIVLFFGLILANPNCARTICNPILKLFHLSISSSVFPTIWKDSFIIPLHKKGAKVNVQNYRGISKLSAIP